MHCMQKAALIIEAKTPLTGWPGYFYDNVYQGAPYNFELEDKLERYKKNATAPDCTKAKADQSLLTEKSRVVYDWIYALEWSKTHLLSKPFVTWTVQDLDELNRCLTRLSIDAPGTHRTLTALWPLCTPSAHEQFILTRIKNRGYVENAAEQEFLDRTNFIFPEPNLIPLLLESALRATQTFLADEAQNVEEIIKTAAYFHFELIRIHAWNEGNKRTARLAMNILLAQYRLMPITFENEKEYIQTLFKCLKENRSTLLKDYIRSLVERRQAQLSLLAKKGLLIQKNTSFQATEQRSENLCRLRTALIVNTLDILFIFFNLY